jgi:hypothetical protein
MWRCNPLPLRYCIQMDGELEPMAPMEKHHVPRQRQRQNNLRLGMWLCFPVCPSVHEHWAVVADKFEACGGSRFWELAANQYRVVSDRAMLQLCSTCNGRRHVSMCVIRAAWAARTTEEMGHACLVLWSSVGKTTRFWGNRKTEKPRCGCMVRRTVVPSAYHGYNPSFDVLLSYKKMEYDPSLSLVLIKISHACMHS